MPLRTGCLLTDDVKAQFISDSDASYWTAGNDLATRNRWVWTSRGYLVHPYVNWLALPDMHGDQQAGRWYAICSYDAWIINASYAWNSYIWLHKLRTTLRLLKKVLIAMPEIFLHRCILMEENNFQWVDADCESTEAFFFCEYGKLLRLKQCHCTIEHCMYWIRMYNVDRS